MIRRKDGVILLWLFVPGKHGETVVTSCKKHRIHIAHVGGSHAPAKAPSSGAISAFVLGAADGEFNGPVCARSLANQTSHGQQAQSGKTSRAVKLKRATTQSTAHKKRGWDAFSARLRYDYTRAAENYAAMFREVATAVGQLSLFLECKSCKKSVSCGDEHGVQYNAVALTPDEVLDMPINTPIYVRLVQEQ